MKKLIKKLIKNLIPIIGNNEKLIAIIDTSIVIIGYYWDPIIANNSQ